MNKNKQLIRQQIVANCKLITSQDKLKFERAVFLKLKPLLEIAHKIAIYNAYAWELSLSVVIENCQKESKALYSPVAYKGIRQMELSVYDSTQTSVFSTAKPALYLPIRWYNMDLILVPVVAVDHHGYRLGKGGGYYDTTLNAPDNPDNTRPVICGVGFGCQFLSQNLPVDSWDLQLDYFASEQGLIKF